MKSIDPTLVTKAASNSTLWNVPNEIPPTFDRYKKHFAVSQTKPPRQAQKVTVYFELHMTRTIRAEDVDEQRHVQDPENRNGRKNYQSPSTSHVGTGIHQGAYQSHERTKNASRRHRKVARANQEVIEIDQNANVPWNYGWGNRKG
eukprot:scaffold20826_cov73-Attheya_sp.AAC.4